MMTQLSIEGMTCGHCQSAVKQALERVEGVKAAEVDLARGIATIQGEADRASLIAAVEEEGYQASSLAP
jgi:copper chaperone